MWAFALGGSPVGISCSFALKARARGMRMPARTLWEADPLRPTTVACAICGS